MRIVHVLNEVVDTGNGIVNATIDLACAQAHGGHQVSVVSSGGGYVHFLETNNIQHYSVNLRPFPVRNAALSMPRLKRLFKKLQPDIVHAHMMTGALLVWAGRTFADFGNFGLITTVHNEWRFASNLMRVGDRVIVLSKNGHRSFYSRGFSLEKLRVVSHGILCSSRREGETLEGGLPLNSAPLVVTLAGLYKRKGVGDLIAAFGEVAREYPKAQLVVAGWGPDRQFFENQRASVEGADRISFVGFVPKPRNLLKQADIFVLASHTESFPLAVAEAREAGCAVIATRVGGVPELLENGRAGILVPAKNVSALSQALRRLLGDAQQLSYWRRASQVNIDWLSCTRMEIETMAVYEDLLRSGNFQKLGREYLTTGLPRRLSSDVSPTQRPS